jgi:hypothetical protein
MGEFPGERGLAVASGAAQHREQTLPLETRRGFGLALLNILALAGRNIRSMEQRETGARICRKFWAAYTYDDHQVFIRDVYATEAPRDEEEC